MKSLLLWSDVNTFDEVNQYETKYLSNAIYNLYEDIQCLKEELTEARAEIDAMHEHAAGEDI